MNGEVIEEFREEDLAAVTDIYNYYVLHSTATWHTHPLTEEEMRQLVFTDNVKYKTFVIKDGGAVFGYVSIREFKPRDAYIGTAEIGIYLRKDCCGKGLGGKALKHLEKYAEGAGVHVLIAIISAENDGSIRLFEKNGYEKCAYFKQVGHKFGRHLDAVAYQKILD